MMGVFVETRNDAFWLDKDGKWRPEGEYEGDFADYEGEWQVGWFGRWHGLTEGDWVGPSDSESECRLRTLDDYQKAHGPFAVSAEEKAEDDEHERRFPS
jgi:hypothetical protein